MFRTALRAVAVLPLALFAAGAAEPPSFAGAWKIHSSISGNESDIECTLAQKDQEISGSCKSDRGPLAVTGKANGAKLSFQFKTMYDGNELTIVYSGESPSPGKISGNVDVQPLGVSGTFTGSADPPRADSK
ncbi:MAG TPA: hypothetical protein DEH78_24180 [Solibacterales bacterium]|nr:hypothetical protein [Bryobacterales bacterium]